MSDDSTTGAEWLVGRLVGMSADIHDKQTVRVHFRGEVTDVERDALLSAFNTIAQQRETIERLEHTIKRGRHDFDSCICRFEADGETPVTECSIHAALRQTVERLGQDNAILRAACEQKDIYTEGVVAERDALSSQVEALREALKWYADRRRYEYDNDCCPDLDNPGKHAPSEDVLVDRGERARTALQGADKPGEGHDTR